MTPSADICNALYALAREHNGQNVEWEIAGVPVLVVQRAEDMDHVLRLNGSNYKKNMVWFRQTMGASRLSEDDEAWRVRRDLTQPYFNKFDRDTTFRLSSAHARAAVQRLAAASAAGSALLDDGALREMALSTLIENFLGMTLADTGLDPATLLELMTYGSAYSLIPAAEGAGRRAELLHMLQLRRQVLAQLKGLRTGPRGHNAMLDGLRDADADPSNSVVLEQELLTFFAAGAVSSTATTGWLCEALARFPEAQTVLRQIAHGFWNQPATAHTWAALAELKPLAAFVSEVLRLYPPTPIVSRIAVEADRIGPHAVAPGGRVIVSFIGVQHDARFRADPWTLDLQASECAPTQTGSGTGTCFGMGARACGGRNIAIVELVSFLSVFCATARFELTDDAPPTFRWTTQMVRDGGNPVRVTLL